MKSLVIGASGQVGGLLWSRCRQRGDECVGTSFRHGRPGLQPLDVRDQAAVTALIQRQRPDFVFLPAALTHVDFAETHPDESRAINVDGSVHVARAVKQFGGALIFFSTEHVFCDSPQPYPEEAACSPSSVYAKTKVEAEQAIRALLPDRHLILRTSWVFGPEDQQKNFVYRAVRTLRAGERLVVPEDQYGQPTFSPDLADTALELATEGCTGTFHVVGPVHLTRLALAQLVCRVFGLDAGVIEGRTSQQLNQPAPRPRFICLKRDKMLHALGRDPICHPQRGLEFLRDAPPPIQP